MNKKTSPRGAHRECGQGGGRPNRKNAKRKDYAKRSWPYKNILNPRYRLYLPSRLSSAICDLIKRLLAWDPLTRIGCLTDAALDVKRHAFFQEIDFGKLKEMELEPPHVPELRSATDMSYFDDPTVEPAFLNEPEYDYSANAWDIDF